MFELRCTVRRCGEMLCEVDGGLACPRGHRFDRAKEGYYGLSQPQDRKSLRPGDNDAAVLARRRWLDAGHCQGLIDALRPLVKCEPRADHDNDLTTAPRRRIVDLGCGEGTFGDALFDPAIDSFCGIDLSKRAIRLAARRSAAHTWVWANADRSLPIADRSVSLVMSLFGRRPVDEIARVLRPDGRCVVAIPGDDDLIELRETIHQSGTRKDRVEKVLEPFQDASLRCVHRERWCDRIRIDADSMRDALAMTYRGFRRSEQARLLESDHREVTVSADLLVLRFA